MPIHGVKHYHRGWFLLKTSLQNWKKRACWIVSTMTLLKTKRLLVNRKISFLTRQLTHTFCPTGSMKHRQVCHYGYEFKYATNNVDATQPLEKQIPDECNNLWPRLNSLMPTLSFQTPNQITVNKYEPGQGIPPHCDTHSAFCDPIFSLSLANGIVMEFRRPSDKQHISVWLPRRSLLIMLNESRYGWTHGITPRKTDVIPVNDGLTVVERKLRVSFTFRRWVFEGKMEEKKCLRVKSKRFFDFFQIEIWWMPLWIFVVVWHVPKVSAKCHRKYWKISVDCRVGASQCTQGALRWNGLKDFRRESNGLLFCRSMMK